MIKNYFKIAFRNLLKHKGTSFINILGLTIGIAACLLIFQYVHFELSYDKFHKNFSQVYRLDSESRKEGNPTSRNCRIDPEIGPALKSDLPEVQRVARAAKWWGGVVSTSGSDGHPVAFNEPNVFFIDDDFFHVFSFPLLKGSFTAINEPNSIIVTEKMSQKYFGNSDPIGKTLKLENHNQGHLFSAIVIGVCRDVPSNSHLKFDFLISRNTVGNEGGPAAWPAYTYLLVLPGSDPSILQAKIIQWGERQHYNKKGDKHITETLSLQPLSDIHLYSDLPDEESGTGNGKIVWFLALIALLILIIAYVNYINLVTSKSIDRAKEVGIRKVLGSQRWHLVKQFFFESFLLNIISVVIALILVQISTPIFGRLFNVKISLSIWDSSSFWAIFFGCFMLGILLSGLYPALMLSAYQPVQVLKNQFLKSHKGITLRKALVIFQFTVSAILIIGTFAVYLQVNYLRNKDMGLNMTQTLIVAAPGGRRENDEEEKLFDQKNQVFQAEILRHSGIHGITFSSNIPGVPIDWTPRYFQTPDAPDKEAIHRPTMAIAPNFIDQFQIKLVAGEKFSVELAKTMGLNNITPIMLNEAAVQALGFDSSQNAIGRFIFSRNGRGINFKHEVVGVVQNFHQSSLKENYTPLIFLITNNASSITHYAVKVDRRNVSSTVAGIESKFKSIFPDSPFESFFLDEFFNEQYKADQQFGQIFGAFAGFAIFIACLGLFGLASFTAHKRIKEIGVRKILGASIKSLLILITKDFLQLILLANLIAWPAAWWLVSKWLHNYAFRIQINLWLFLIPALLLLFIALLTVSVQAIKAAIANPVKSLRTE